MEHPPRYELNSLPERESYRPTSPVSLISSLESNRRSDSEDQFVETTLRRDVSSILGNTTGVQHQGGLWMGLIVILSHHFRTKTSPRMQVYTSLEY